MSTQPIVPPGGEFPVPSTSSSPLLVFRCAPAIKPYLSEDLTSSNKNDNTLIPKSFIIDTIITHTEVQGAQEILLPSLESLSVDGKGLGFDVEIRVGGKRLGRANVPLNATKVEVPFDLGSLKPQKNAFDVECLATFSPTSSNPSPNANSNSASSSSPSKRASSSNSDPDQQAKSQTFQTTSQLFFLPPPASGRSVTRMDLRTGALLSRPATGKGGPYETVFPIGFYTDFGGYLASNLSVLDDLKSQGFTIVHPVPTFDNLTAFDLVVDRMQELGLWLMYDMRWTYLLTGNVTEEVNRIKNRPNLLLWYTADEPDGWEDPQNGTTIAYDLINSLDGYHPVSLVLNCENYFFDAYTAGTDIVLQDTYMIGNNVTFSSEWGTPCTLDYGDCGCDNCKGEFEDISTRMDEFADRLFSLGWDRTKAVWTVPQAFGGSSYWKRTPTGQEWVVQSILGINHGGLGVVPWNDPTTADIKNSATLLAKAMPTMKEFILNPAAKRGSAKVNRVDIALWTVGGQTLLLAANLNYEETEVPLSQLGIGKIGKGVQGRQVFDSGAKIQGDSLVFDSIGSAGWVFR
ncbi:hypothetical protein QCA50_012375 [Cerrena zonata]|uniref:Uncharacterized protein n=1 Tax=Cerrena zonata TaxID=2478898 RepID=A0AAW0FS07_9APHY